MCIRDSDFIVPLILLDSSQLSTIQLAIKKLFSQYSSQWALALPALDVYKRQPPSWL